MRKKAFDGSLLTSVPRPAPLPLKTVIVCILFLAAVYGPTYASTGIQLPFFENQIIHDAVPSGAVWWDPTDGNDGDDGSRRSLAKKTFAAAEALISAGGTIVVAGGTHTLGSPITPAKSGSSGKPITLMAEPGKEVLFYREDTFKGALERTWTWTSVDAGLKIWRSPNLGITDETRVTRNAEGRGEPTNAPAGFMIIPKGAYGRPHLMRMMWYGRAGDYGVDAWKAPATGPNAGKFIKEGAWGGPGFRLGGDGYLYVRMQRNFAQHDHEWPKDGRMGTCTNANGDWVEPVTEDPNDYAFHITMFNGDFGSGGPITIDMNGQSWWHVKGINCALMNQALRLPGGSSHNVFDRCTWWPQWSGVDFRGTTPNNKFTHVLFLSADIRHLSWREHKTGNYWWQHGRSALMRCDGANTGTGTGTLFEDCTAFGWFDLALMCDVAIDGVITLDHCAFLNAVDDGFQQCNSTGALAFNASYCYFAGGPPWSGNSDAGFGPRDWIWKHCVIDNRIPMLWTPIGVVGGERKGVCPHFTYPIHSGGSNGPARVLKLVNCTIIQSPDAATGGHAELIVVGTSPANHDVPAGRIHEVYNNILAIVDNKRYPSTDYHKDMVTCRLSCDRSTAGVQHYDYNLYFRDVPSPVLSPMLVEIQDSRNVNRKNYNSLNDFRASAQYALSASMYSDGTTGHEQHGVEGDPQFMDLAALDYRPQSAGAKSGAKDVTGITGESFKNWKGALDPNGDGNEVGPRAPDDVTADRQWSFGPAWRQAVQGAPVVEVFDALGRRVRVALAAEMRGLKNLPAGVYVARIRAANESVSRRVLVSGAKEFR